MKSSGRRVRSAARAPRAHRRACVLVLAAVCAGVAATAVRRPPPALAQTAAVPGASAAAFYNGPADCCESGPRLAVDARGNFYVAGRSTTSRQPDNGPANDDIATVKYDPQGNELWSRRFDGGRHSTDEPADLAVDGAGNVYVTGFSAGAGSNFVTLKYDAEGNFQWARHAGPSAPPAFASGLALDVDAAGNVYATGREAYRFVAGGSTPVYRFRTVKYDTHGNEQWQRAFEPAGLGAAPADVKADSSGNVYVTGAGSVAGGTGPDSDIYTVKYDAQGNELWARGYAAPGRDEGVKLHLDAAGLYVLGRLNLFSNDNADVAVLKYTPAGQLARATASGRPDNEYAVDFAVDGAGNAYPVALLLHPQRDYAPPDRDTLTYKFDAAGAVAWRRIYARLGAAQAQGVALDGAGGDHTGLTAPQGREGNQNYFVVKYNAADGAQLDEKSFDGPGAGRDQLTDIESDAYGNVYLTGVTDWNTASPRSTDFMTLKLGAGVGLPPPPPRVNVALASNGATATASSWIDAGRAPSHAINGERAGRDWGTTGGWHDSTADAFPDWLEVTFNGPKTISEINVFSVQDNFPRPSEPTETMAFTKYGLADFDVQYWTGSAWATVAGGAVRGNSRVWLKLVFAPLTTGKIRVVAARGLAGYSRLTEVEAWADSAGTPPPAPRVNVAAAAHGATASASSELDAGRAASGAINGDRAGRNWGRGGGWHCATQNVFPDWLQVNFAGPKTITEINVFSVQDNFNSPSEPDAAMTFSRYGLAAFEVQYWNGAGWVTVPGGGVAGNNRVWRSFTFPPLTTDRVRVLVTNGLAGASRVAEVEAY